jgi:hypothetical protein
VTAQREDLVSRAEDPHCHRLAAPRGARVAGHGPSPFPGQVLPRGPEVH